MFTHLGIPKVCSHTKEVEIDFEWSLMAFLFTKLPPCLFDKKKLLQPCMDDSKLTL